uniref:F-box domain-containing protein n=1 Tax=Leersia perrieri TaxID=77586 RepID=A0A0D9XZW0_9ORYZ
MESDHLRVAGKPEVYSAMSSAFSLDDLPDAVLAEIVKRVVSTSDLNSISLVSKRFYAIESEQRSSIRLGRGILSLIDAMSSLCSRFVNLLEVEIDYSGWAGHMNPLEKYFVESNWPIRSNLISYIEDFGMDCLASCKKLMSLRLNSVSATSSHGLLSVAVGCKNLTTLHIINCNRIVGTDKWLEYIGSVGSLEELVVKNCERISQYDLLKFGLGWRKLKKFEFKFKRCYNRYKARDPYYVDNYQYGYDFCCESLKDLTLATIVTRPEIGLRSILRKCKALEKLCLHYVNGISDHDIITISQNCSNLRSISLWQGMVLCELPDGTGAISRTPLTDESFKALALRSHMLQAVELMFYGCCPDWPSEIGFTQDGLVTLFQSCPIRHLVLNGANFFDDEGMEALSSTQFLETLELIDCVGVTDVGMRFLAQSPCLKNLTLQMCYSVTDDGVCEVAHARKLEYLTVEGCRQKLCRGLLNLFNIKMISQTTTLYMEFRSLLTVLPAISSVFLMEDLPDPVLAEIVKRVVSTSDLNSISLVSKRFYAIESEQRSSIRIGHGILSLIDAMSSLCSRFVNLLEVEIDYSGWAGHMNPLEKYFVESNWPIRSNLISYIEDFGMDCLASCKNLMSLRLNSVSATSSHGLLSVAVGCKNLTCLHILNCNRIVGSDKWLEYIGSVGSLEELVVKNCERISQYDLLKFGSGWMNLKKFEFKFKRTYNTYEALDPYYVDNYQYGYDFCCDSLKDVTLATIVTRPEIGLRCLLRKCSALEKLCLHFVIGLTDRDIITISQNCSNLRSISLWQEILPCELPDGSGIITRTPLTDESLEALALRCHVLEVVELMFYHCSPDWPSEIGFTQDGLVTLFQSCPIRHLVLIGANFFNDEGMEALSSTQFLETLELRRCVEVTDAGMRFLAQSPCLKNLTLQTCYAVTDDGVCEVARARKLESLTVEGCHQVSVEALQGAAKSVHYKDDCPDYYTRYGS